MSATIVLAFDEDKRRAIEWIHKAPVNSTVTFERPKRSLPQNRRMWAMLGEVSKQLAYHGQRLSREDWALIFLDGLHRELRVVPNLDGNGFVPLNRSTSKLSKDDMSAMIDLIRAYGDQHGVVFKEPRDG